MMENTHWKHGGPRLLQCSLYFCGWKWRHGKDIANEIIHQRYQPATPSFLNAGRAQCGELVSCFLIQPMTWMRLDALSTLPFNFLVSVVGLGFLSNLSWSWAPIMGWRRSCRRSCYETLEDSFIKPMGQRQGAGWFTPQRFPLQTRSSTKKEMPMKKSPGQNLSLASSCLTNSMIARKNEENVSSFSPYSVEREYGVPV